MRKPAVGGREYRLDCAATAMRHRIAAVLFDAMSESGATHAGIVKVTGLSGNVVSRVLSAEPHALMSQIVAVGLAVGVRLDVRMEPRVMPTTRSTGATS